MATIGQALTAPESGWKRYDERDSNIEYSSGFIDYSYASSSNGTFRYRFTSTINDYIKFNFTGKRLRIINLQTAQTEYSPTVFVKIDGVEYNYTREYITVNQRLDFESPLLPDKEHYVKIFVKDGKGFGLDAIDIDSTGVLKPYTVPIKKIALKNPTTNQHYSLANKTIIPLPDSSSKNMILHGIESGKEIKLDEAFDKMKYVQDTSEVLGEGKIFTHNLDLNDIKINKIIL